MRTAAVSVLLLLSTSAGAWPAEIQVDYDPDAFISTIRIRAENGEVAWSDLLRGLARARGHDDTALDGTIPNAKFEVTGRKGLLVRTGLNLVLLEMGHLGVLGSSDSRAATSVRREVLARLGTNP